MQISLVKPLTALLPLLALCAGCGGSGSADHKASGPSKDAYLRSAEAICAKATTQQKGLTFPTTPAALPAYAQKLLDLATTATHDLEGLEPPTADRAAIRAKVLTPLEGQLAQGRTYVTQLRTAAAANDQAALGRLVAHPPTGSKADLSWMRSYGFRSCVEAADTSG